MRRKRCGKRGSAIVEAALILPVVILLLAAVLSFGMEEYAAVTDACREHEDERAVRPFRAPAAVLSLYSLSVFSDR